MTTRKLLMSALAIAAVYTFVFVVDTDAQSVCDFDCEGSTLCTLEIDGMEVVVGGVNFMDGTDPDDVSPTEKEVKIKCKDLSWRKGNNSGEARNDRDKDSKITITSNQSDGDPFYPASAKVVSYVIVKIDGEEYTSKDPLVLESSDEIRSWPSEEEVTYKLQEDVTYEGANGKVVFKAGGTVTMKGS